MAHRRSPAGAAAECVRTAVQLLSMQVCECRSRSLRTSQEGSERRRGKRFLQASQEEALQKPGDLQTAMRAARASCWLESMLGATSLPQAACGRLRQTAGQGHTMAVQRRRTGQQCWWTVESRTTGMTSWVEMKAQLRGHAWMPPPRAAPGSHARAPGTLGALCPGAPDSG